METLTVHSSPQTQSPSAAGRADCLCNIARDVSLTKAWKDSAAPTMLLQLSLPADAVALFGGMREIALNVTISGNTQHNDYKCNEFVIERRSIDPVDCLTSRSWGQAPTRLS